MALTSPFLQPWPTKPEANLLEAKGDTQATLTPSTGTDSDDLDFHILKGPAEAKLMVEDAKLMTGTEALFTLVSFLFNIAQLTLPFCFVRVGWLAAPLLIAASLVCMLAALMLQEALYALVSRGIPFPEYSDLATNSLGPAYAAVAQVVALAELTVYGCNCAINLGSTVAAVLQLSKATGILASSALCLLLSVFSDRVFAYISLLSSAATLAILGLLLYNGWQQPDWEMPTGSLNGSDYIPSSFAMMLFTAGTHPLISGVMHSTRSHMDMRQAIVGAWTIYTAVTVSCGGLAYLMYGFSLQPFVMDNIGKDFQLRWQVHGAKLRTMAGLWMAVKILGGVVPLTRPLANGYARRMGLLSESEHAGPLLMFPVLLSLALAAILLADCIEAMESVAGCTITSFNALCLPAVSYLLICKPSGASYYCAVSFVILGMVMACSPLASFAWFVFQQISQAF